jgi:hypothetical protein
MLLHDLPQVQIPHDDARDTLLLTFRKGQIDTGQ